MVKVDLQVPKTVSDGLWPSLGSKRRMSGQELVTLNVGGKVFTTRSSTLQQFPGSRLMRMLDGRDKEFKMVDGQIFVDRDTEIMSKQYRMNTLYSLLLGIKILPKTCFCKMYRAVLEPGLCERLIWEVIPSRV